VIFGESCRPGCQWTGSEGGTREDIGSAFNGFPGRVDRAVLDVRSEALERHSALAQQSTGNMKVTLSIDDVVIRRARRRAEALGTSVNQLVREYLEHLAGKTDPNEDAAEFERLSRLAQGDSRGWEFNREELHERR